MFTAKEKKTVDEEAEKVCFQCFDSQKNVQCWRSEIVTGKVGEKTSLKFKKSFQRTRKNAFFPLPWCISSGKLFFLII
jgi:hypothetical protein